MQTNVKVVDSAMHKQQHVPGGVVEKQSYHGRRHLDGDCIPAVLLSLIL